MTEPKMPGGGGGTPEVINKNEQFKKAKYKSSISNLRNTIILLGMEYDAEQEFLASMRAYLTDLYNGPDAIILNPEQLEVAINCMLLNKAKPETFGEAGEGYEKIREIATNRLDQPKIIRYQYGELAYGSDLGVPKPNKVAKENEDRVGVDTKNNFFVVSDGVGGHAFGDVAAQYLVESLLQGEYSEAGIKQAFAQAFDKIAKYPQWLEHKEDLMKTGNIKEEDLDFPDACVVACKLDGNEMTVFLAGDTRLLVIGKDGQVRFSTFDQGLSNHVTGTFGNVVRQLSYLRVQKVTLEEGDRVCLMSDGVTDNFSNVHLSLLGLIKDHQDALWEYLYVDGQWDLLEKKFPGFKANNQVMIEKTLAEIKKIYDAGNKNLAELMNGRSTKEIFSALSRHLDAKMNGERSLVVSNDVVLGKPDNRSFLMFTYEPKAVSETVAQEEVKQAVSENVGEAGEPVIAGATQGNVPPQEDDLTVTKGNASQVETNTPPVTETRPPATSEQAQTVKEIKSKLAEIKLPETPKGEFLDVSPENEANKEPFEKLLDKLTLEEAHYQHLKSKITHEILDLEEANKKINDFTAFELDSKRLDKETEYLKTYGDYCRTYTLNIQRLRELDAQLKRAEFLYHDFQEKREILSAHLKGSLSPQRMEKLQALIGLWDEEIEEKVQDKQRLRLLFTDKNDKGISEIKNINIHVVDGREFASISTSDERTAREFANYEEWQNSLLESSKQISGYDHEIIKKIFHLDFLAQKVDFSSLPDKNLAKRLDSWYYHAQQKISRKYGILLPTVKNNIPLVFKGAGVNIIPSEYCQNLLLHNRKNDPALSEKFDKLNDGEALVFVEVTLLGKVLQDSTINIKQLTEIARRLNELLSKNKFLKDPEWLPLGDRDFVSKNYPGLKIVKGSFQRLSLAELRKRSLSLGEDAKSGIFELSLKYYNLDYYSNTDEEVVTWAEHSKQEELAHNFISDFKKKFEEVFGKKEGFEELSIKFEDNLYQEIFPLLSFAKVKKLQDVSGVLTKQADYVRASNPKLAKFYETIVTFYQNN